MSSTSSEDTARVSLDAAFNALNDAGQLGLDEAATSAARTAYNTAREALIAARNAL